MFERAIANQLASRTAITRRRADRHAAGRDAQFVEAVAAMLSVADDLSGDIDTIWNATPETLAALADWADTLAVQQTELRALLVDLRLGATSVGRFGRPVVRLGRIGRDIAREIAPVLSPGGRIGRLVTSGHRLLRAQAAAAGVAREATSRGLLHRHRAATVRHLNRLRASISTG